MAISWGTTEGHLRVGIDISQSPSSVTKDTSSVTLTVKYYVQTVSWGFSDNQTLNLSGDIGGSIPYSISSGTGQTVTKHVGSRTLSVSTSYSGTVSRSFTATVSGAYNGATPSKTRSHSVAKRPPQAPAAPSGASVSRSADTQQNVSWANTSPTSSAAPYTGLHIDRWSIATGEYRRVATVSTRTSWSDSTTNANNQFRYRVRAYNSTGTSGWAYTDYISTTPAAPSTPKATKTSGGDITLTWGIGSINKVTAIEVWITTDGVDGTARDITIVGTPTSWTHASPDPSKTYQYRVKAQAGADSNDSAPNLYSAFSGRSNTVQLLTNPAKPTDLSPSGVVRDGSQDNTLTWKHNSVDSSDQTAFQVAHRVVGSGIWNYTGQLASTASTWTLPADTYTNGQDIEWAVQTWGLYTEPSVYGYSGPITLSTPPTATINTPTDAATLDTAALAVGWAFYDAEGHAQNSWQAALYDAAGSRLELKSAAGTATSWAFATTLADGSTYQVGVKVRDSTGLWSVEDRATFSVEYALPPAPAITTQWLPDSGAVVIAVSNPAADDGQVEATSNKIWHSTNSEDWALVGTVPVGGAITDYLPKTNGLNYYRVEAWSDLPSVASASAVVITEEMNRVWLNAGPGFGLGVPLLYNPGIDIEDSRDKVLHKFAGRTKPVEYTGEHTGETIALTARLIDHTPEEVKELALARGVACYRDPFGRRVFVSIGSVSFSHERMGRWSMSASLTEVDRD